MSRTKALFSHRLLSLVERCLARKLRFHIFHFQILKDVPHESFVFTSSTITCGEMSRTKASFSHLPLSDFEGCPARKRRFHIVYYHLWRDVSHEIFVITSSTFTFGRTSRTKASFSHLPLPDFEANLRCAYFYCVLQLSLCRSHCNGCVKVAWSCSCERSILSFAARHRKSYWSCCIKAAIAICQQVF